jgi:hypothetical protein
MARIGRIAGSARTPAAADSIAGAPLTHQRLDVRGQLPRMLIAADATGPPARPNLGLVPVHPRACTDCRDTQYRSAISVIETSEDRTSHAT